ncbi:EAL domain-containing protein [Acidithiobacillus ferrivorans]|nr:EAL domain-containing protein [Acidithiobacillus ferrivorans]
MNTEATSTLPNFLGLQETDFLLIDRYVSLLEAETPALARDFYDYLLSHPVTAAVFRDFSSARLDALIQKQAEHIRGLLISHLDKPWRESMRKIGALHHSLGIDPSWVASAYILYWRHWQKVLLESVPETDRDALRDALFRLLIGDLMVQLDGYARASRETDADRLALFSVLLGVLAAPQGAASPRPEELLQQICEALPRKSASVRLASYVISGTMGDTLTLECLGGVSLPALEILKATDDPCWMALETGQAVIQAVADPSAPAWMQSLHNRVEEIGIFPFGAEDLRGAILIGAHEKGYFRRVGSDYFYAFAHLGEMVLLLRNQSLRDPMTGLPNRTLFLDRLENARAQTIRNEQFLGVAILDLDGFKQVNDRLGHPAGDDLLLAVVQGLQGELRAGDTLARMGGDEFGLILPGLNSVDDLEALCDRLLATIRKPMDINGEAIRVSGSIGITLYPLDDNDSRTLIQHADMALYAAKDAGRDRWHLHTLALDDAVQAEEVMRTMLEQALKDNTLILHYQPIVSNAGEVMGVEALIRLQHPEQGLLPPAAFFSALDHPRLARPVGRFVLETALRQGAVWQEAGLSLRISVNISARHLLDARFLNDLREAMAKYPGMPPNQLEIEITESAPLSDMAGAQLQLRICNQLGVHVALDDFGTGNASLTYLQQLHAQSIKIDQSFVRDVINDPKDLAIVAAVITASRMLGIRVIAEGVETAEHATLLTKMGCSHLQGYFFSRPLSPDSIPAWVTGFRPTARSEDALPPMDVLSPILKGHLLRIQMFLRALRHENPFPAHTLEADAEDFCHLGRWLRGEGLFNFGQSPDFAEIVARHERLHQLAREAKSFLDEEDDEAAVYQGHLLELENRLLVAELLAMTRGLP